MISDHFGIVARVRAHVQKRAIPIRKTSSLARSSAPPFGIVPMRVVSEQRAQAIAFGLLSKAPNIVVTWHPLGRESSWLEPFAQALDEYLTSCLLGKILPRIWVPHSPALEIIELLGHRYQRNKKASEALRWMGSQCRALAAEYTFDDQQVVVVANELLMKHVVTGQQPIEDLHLDALLAWVDPIPGVDPQEEADRRALTPAAAMLTRKDDDEVEKLRKIAKKRGTGAMIARKKIESILKASARREWDLLLKARRAFSRLNLRPDQEIDKQVTASFERVSFTLTRDVSMPSLPHSLSRRLNSYEHAIQVVEDIDIRTDKYCRERARCRGRVFFAKVVAINQPRPSQKPCTLTLHTFQDVLRVRPGQSFQTLDSRVKGRVISIREAGSAGGTLIDLKLKTGVRKSTCPKLNSSTDWTDTVIVDMKYQRDQVYKEMREDDHPLVFGTKLPSSSPRNLQDVDLMVIASILKSKG